MHHVDINMDDNHFDNFIFASRKRRPMRRRKVRRNIKEVKSRARGVLTNLQTDMNDVRKKKKRGHKNILNKIKTQGFFANPKNHRAIYMQVRKMAKDIDGLSQKLIEAKKPCECKTRGRSKVQYRNFGGENNLQTMWNKYKTPLLIGGAVYFFFFSPMGKKLIK
jgi:hypothetical protein